MREENLINGSQPRVADGASAGRGRKWLGRGLFALSVAGLPLSRLVLARLGRTGGVLVVVACTVLFARAIQFVVTGTAARLRALPCFLAFAELTTDGLAVATGFWIWIWQPILERRLGARRSMQAHPWGTRLNQCAVAATFLLHTARLAIYLSPSQGRRDAPPARE